MLSSFSELGFQQFASRGFSNLFRSILVLSLFIGGFAVEVVLLLTCPDLFSMPFHRLLEGVCLLVLLLLRHRVYCCFH